MVEVDLLTDGVLTAVDLPTVVDLFDDDLFTDVVLSVEDDLLADTGLLAVDLLDVDLLTVDLLDVDLPAVDLLVEVVVLLRVWA